MKIKQIFQEASAARPPAPSVKPKGRTGPGIPPKSVPAASQVQDDIVTNLLLQIRQLDYNNAVELLNLITKK